MILQMVYFNFQFVDESSSEVHMNLINMLSVTIQF